MSVVSLHRSGENDVDFMGNLETEEGELPDDLDGATGRTLVFIIYYLDRLLFNNSETCNIK